MRRQLKLLLPIVVLAIIAAACGSDDSGGGSAADDLGGRQITVAVENAYPPYNFIPEGETEGAGWDYDAWREICDRLNCEVTFVEAGWPDVIVETGQGQYDAAADGITITDERKAEVDFSDPYMFVEQKLMVRLDEDRFGSADEFWANPDYRVGTQIGTTNYDRALAILGSDERIDAYDQFGLAVQALIAGDVDAVIIDDTAGQGYKGENQDDIRLLPDVLSSDGLGFIYPHDSDLIGPVNDALAEMKDDGTLEDLRVKWFIEYET
jgi:polar amino acid transport system substrate-binding protein